MARTMPPRLIVVDQDARYGEWLKHHLGVICPESPITLLSRRDFDRWCEQLGGRDCDVLMLAASFGSSPEDPQAHGLDLLRQLREKTHFPAVIAVAEDGNELTAVRALQLGAVDYLPKRLLTPERLKTSVKLALRMLEKRVARRIASLAGPATVKRPKPSRSAAPADASMETPAAVLDERAIDDSVESPALPRADLANIVDGEGLSQSPVAEPLDPSTGVTGDAHSTQAAATSTAASAHLEGAEGTRETNGEEVASRLSESTDPDEPTDPPGPRDPRDPRDPRGPRATSGTDEATNRGGSAHAGESVNTGASARANESVDNRASTHASESANADPAAPAGESVNIGTSARAGEAGRAAPPAAAGEAADTGPTTRAATPAPLPPARAPGGEFMSANFIPGYTIHATIGESEKAAVYVATSAALGHNVALKVSKSLRDEAAGRQFLEREYTAIVAIRDPSVVQIFDYGVHAGYEYLVMEYLPRGDLKARMQQVLSEMETLRYVAQIAAALQVVHNAGLLHRDLKPPNVMLRENGDVALIDFGLARALDGSTPSTRVGVLRGSPYYMSPEQAMGEVLDVRSDFYSLGVMYYEMLTGKKPYTGGSAMDVLQQHVHAPLPMLPKALIHHEPLLLKLLAKSRDDRFASAQDILVAVAAQRDLIQPSGTGDLESSAA